MCNDSNGPPSPHQINDVEYYNALNHKHGKVVPLEPGPEYSTVYSTPYNGKSINTGKAIAKTVYWH